MGVDISTDLFDMAHNTYPNEWLIFKNENIGLLIDIFTHQLVELKWFSFCS
jgi:hypothetical protein